MSYIKGKALITIEKNFATYNDFEIHVFIQTPSENWMIADELRDMVQYEPPDIAYKLQDFEKIWLSVVYEMDWSQDYWGEWDCYLTYLKVKTLKRRKGRHG